MSKIHYFQRYSQRENVATNNTLLLFSRLYNESTYKFNDFINSLIEKTGVDALTLVKFEQQKKTGNSIPDGFISQSSFKVVIETKLGRSENFSNNQLINHLKSFENEDKKILLALSPTKMKDEKFEKVKNAMKENLNGKNVNLVNITFQDIVTKFDEVLNDYDVQLKSIIDDYEEYCIQEELIRDDEFRMRIVPCGGSHELNMKYGIHYMPSSRNISEHRYLGIYTNKKVIGIGKVVKRVNVIVEGNNIVKIDKDLTKEQLANLQNIIIDTHEKLGWDLGRCEHEYTIVEEMYKTDYEKTSPGGIQGHRFKNLKEILNVNELPETVEIAEMLKEKKWK